LNWSIFALQKTDRLIFIAWIFSFC